jgi:hypothetical protein
MGIAKVAHADSVQPAGANVRVTSSGTKKPKSLRLPECDRLPSGGRQRGQVFGHDDKITRPQGLGVVGPAGDLADSPPLGGERVFTAGMQMIGA